MDEQDWTEPGAYEVAPGIHRIPLPLPMDGLRAVNVYTLATPTGVTLIDGGWAIAESRARFETSLAQLGYEIGDIEGFLVTHMHRDHYTQAYVVGREVGAPVALGMGDKATMDLMHGGELGDDPNLARLERAGAMAAAPGWRRMMGDTQPSMDDYGMPDRWLDADVAIEVGERRIDALATPGHTQGHYVYADVKAGVLFAGDHVLPHITPSIGFEPAWVQQPLRDFLDSLTKVRSLPDLHLLPAHGPAGGSVHRRVEELVAFHDERLEQCRVAVAGGARTAWEVAGEIPWRSRGVHRDRLNDFDTVLAAFETLAHLELLAARGGLRRTLDGPLAVFTSPSVY